MLSLIQRAQTFAQNVAIISQGESFTYQQLLDESCQFASTLLGGTQDLKEGRIGFIVEPGFDYVKTQWAIWRAGGIAVPLNPKAPISSHEYALGDADISQIVCSPEHVDSIKSIANGVPVISSKPNETAQCELPDIDPVRRAMILYTSGTTGSPKGVVTTHANIEAQITTLTSAWHWSSNDHIINVLPLHHVHGIVNVVSCALWSGATCEFMPKFDEGSLLDRLTSGQVSLFMAVPTIYYKLVSFWESLEKTDQKQISEGLEKMRLMVSGSAALPISVLGKWREISGHTLLERYGMTEIGMAISNPYEAERTPGHIGTPLPGVDVRLVDEKMNDVERGEQGEILVKGSGVFAEYWNKAEATKKAFTADDWFKTGDVAIDNDGNFKIVGRSSIDIIKSGGYKLSALEIEEVLREHKSVKDCGVVGIPDEEWGEIVAASLVVDQDFDQLKFKEWMSTKLPGYKIPRIIQAIDDLPRNAMGKVVKNELKKMLNPGK
ncbi:MAG: acyl-CoA synthetase [Cyclobacteriaceae bacterium]